MTTRFEEGFAYDAMKIFGFDRRERLLPVPEPGEIVICYGGWSLQHLAQIDASKELMYPTNWYYRYGWSERQYNAFCYRLRIPVKGSNCKTFTEQEKLLSEGEKVAPAVLVASALLCHYLQTGEQLLGSNDIRCKERLDTGDHIKLSWGGRQLFLNSSPAEDCSDELWVASSVFLPNF